MLYSVQAGLGKRTNWHIHGSYTVVKNTVSVKTKLQRTRDENYHSIIVRQCPNVGNKVDFCRSSACLIE